MLAGLPVLDESTRTASTSIAVNTVPPAPGTCVVATTSFMPAVVKVTV